MTRRPRWVVDTNTLVSAFLWQGLPGNVIALAGEKIVRLVTSRILLDELEQVLHRAKFAKSIAKTGLSAEELMASYKQLVTIVAAPPLTRPVSRDPKDDAVLATALAGRVDAIISGDKDLLVLERFQTISILTVRDALAKLGTIA
ncbi:MAG: putative toxin-antitoxin system toxin component, PIN family [Rudaea sp.]|uniref:putative toxin-antitoxin system toxin component, PIN family n=1 Tax=Rudaea sp. TaxID=2136325 RepID=UPI0039E6110A